MPAVIEHVVERAKGVDVAGIVREAPGAIMYGVARSDLFKDLSSVRSEPTMIGQVVGRAQDISHFSPPVWYVNFPQKRT